VLVCTRSVDGWLNVKRATSQMRNQIRWIQISFFSAEKSRSSTGKKKASGREEKNAGKQMNQSKVL